MTSLGYFQQISHEHLCVGHTHEDIGFLAALSADNMNPNDSDVYALFWNLFAFLCRSEMASLDC